MLNPSPVPTGLALAFALSACTQTSQPPPTTRAASTDSSGTSAGDAGSSPSTPSSTVADSQMGVDPRYRACNAATDCVAVEPVGCCHNGRMVAVAAAQKDAYLASFTCPQKRPLCPMYRLLPDGRVPSCEGSQCVMKAP